MQRCRGLSQSAVAGTSGTLLARAARSSKAWSEQSRRIQCDAVESEMEGHVWIYAHGCEVGHLWSRVVSGNLGRQVSCSFEGRLRAGQREIRSSAGNLAGIRKG